MYLWQQGPFLICLVKDVSLPTILLKNREFHFELVRDQFNQSKLYIIQKCHIEMDGRVSIKKCLHVFEFTLKNLTRVQSLCKSEDFVAIYAVDKDLILC